MDFSDKAKKANNCHVRQRKKKWKLIQCDPLWKKEKEQKMIHNWKHELSEFFEDFLNKHFRQVINNDSRQ